MTETFAIGTTAAASPFREDNLTGVEDLALPVEPEASPPVDDLLEGIEESSALPVEVEIVGEQRAAQVVHGQSPIAVQAARQWNSIDRPAGWVGKVYGLVVHTTGGSLPASAKDKRIYHTVRAVEYYSQSHGCHYVNGWRGVAGGDLLQVANEREQANGVGVGDQRRSIDQGRFEKDLPAAVVMQWRTRWPGVEHPLRLLPGTRTANSCYVHVECVPCVFHHGGRLITAATPLRPGLRFTQAQHEAVAQLACDIARRNGWPLQETWWRTARLLGHEDLTPYNRHDNLGGWDPGGMRAMPYFDWDFVYQQIERECRVQAPAAVPAPALARPSWWPFSEAEDELFTAASGHDPSAESWTDALDEQELDEQDEQEEQEDEESAGLSLVEQEKWEEAELERYATEDPEGPYDDAAYEESRPVDHGENVLLEPLRVAMAVAGGERDENKLTNAVFFARYPERAGRAIAKGETDAAAKWKDIRDQIVRPLLARTRASARRATLVRPVLRSGSRYNRAGALAYARKYWLRPCDDQFVALGKASGRTHTRVPPGTVFEHEFGVDGKSSWREHALLPDGSQIPFEHLDDCTHFISCCIGERPGEPCGGLELRYRQLGAPPSAPYAIVRVSTMVDYLTGKLRDHPRKAEIVAERSDDERHIGRLEPGDLIAYFNTEKHRYSHLAMLLPGNKIACHSFGRSDQPACTWSNDWNIGRDNHRWTFLHITT